MIVIEDLVIGQKYVFYRNAGADGARFEPATYFGCDALGTPTVQFCFDNSMEELPHAIFDPSPKPLTREWLQHEMIQRSDQIRALKAESDEMYNLLKEVK